MSLKLNVKMMGILLMILGSHAQASDAAKMVFECQVDKCASAAATTAGSDTDIATATAAVPSECKDVDSSKVVGRRDFDTNGMASLNADFSFDGKSYHVDALATVFHDHEGTLDDSVQFLITAQGGWHGSAHSSSSQNQDGVRKLQLPGKRLTPPHFSCKVHPEDVAVTSLPAMG